MGKCSYVEAELKYQGARFARKWNVRRFSGLRRRTGCAWRDARRKCAVEKEVVSPRRHGGKFEWPEARRRYRSLFPRGIPIFGGEGKNAGAASCVVRCDAFSLRIYSAINRTISWFCLTRRPDFGLFRSSDDLLARRR